MITIPVEIGDIILTGKFKNKSTEIKSIGKDEHGMPTINGRKVVTFRIKKNETKKEHKMKKSELRQIIKEEILRLLNLNEGNLPNGWKKTGKNKWRHDASKFTITVEKEFDDAAKKKIKAASIRDFGREVFYDTWQVVGKVDGYHWSVLSEDPLINEKDAVEVAEDIIENDYSQGAQR